MKASVQCVGIVIFYLFLLAMISQSISATGTNPLNLTLNVNLLSSNNSQTSPDRRITHRNDGNNTNDNNLQRPSTNSDVKETKEIETHNPSHVSIDLLNTTDQKQTMNVHHNDMTGKNNLMYVEHYNIPFNHNINPNTDHVKLIQPFHNFEGLNEDNQMVQIHQNQLLNVPNDMYKHVVREYYIQPYDDTFEKHKQMAQVYYNQYLNNKEELKPIIKEHHILPFEGPNYVQGQIVEKHFGGEEMHKDIAQENHNQPVEGLPVIDKQMINTHNLPFRNQVLRDFQNVHNSGQNHMILEGQHKVLNGLPGLYVPTFNNRMHFEEIPLIQKKLSQAEVMRDMDNYTLQRKKTHVPLPTFLNNTVENVQNNSKLKRSVFATLSSVFQRNGNSKMSDSDNDKYKIEITKSKIVQEEEKAKVIENNSITDSLSHVLDDIDFKELDDPKILEALRLQTEKMYDLIYQVQQNERRFNTKYNDFEDIVSSVKERRKTKSSAQKTTKPTTTTILPTVEMVIDETMVKEALRNDPYIKRIMKLSNMKKQEYFKNRIV